MGQGANDLVRPEGPAAPLAAQPAGGLENFGMNRHGSSGFAPKLHVINVNVKLKVIPRLRYVVSGRVLTPSLEDSRSP